MAPGEEVGGLVWLSGAPEREERGEGYLRCPRRGPKYPRLKLNTKTPVGAKPEICTRSHPTAEFLSSTRNLLYDAAMSMKIRFAVLGVPRNPGRWPVLRKPPKLHAREDSRLQRRGPRRRSRLGLLTALDAVRRPLPPRPQRGPRRRRRLFLR